MCFMSTVFLYTYWKELRRKFDNVIRLGKNLLSPRNRWTIWSALGWIQGGRTWKQNYKVRLDIGDEGTRDTGSSKTSDDATGTAEDVTSASCYVYWEKFDGCFGDNSEAIHFCRYSILCALHHEPCSSVGVMAGWTTRDLGLIPWEDGDFLFPTVPGRLWLTHC
jgi:hypothetical protein